MTNRPIAKFQEFPAEISLFEQESENGPWLNAQVSKIYKEGEDYKRANNFNRNDLLKLHTLVPQAIERMQSWELEQRQARSQSDSRDIDSLKERARTRRTARGQSQNHEETP
ncbi:hypothetical protein [Roseibium sp. Sym1]|uniref:hypothetical protein n=1 Tax=Roseibium sp. Sym1 TaxID=3016006 RepID=UPI0022B5A03F|nr:hypothetical protein [Roseibium sp. Sym1]